MTRRKYQLLPRIQAYHGVSDHQYLAMLYLAMLIQRRDHPGSKAPMISQAITKMITDQVAAMGVRFTYLHGLPPRHTLGGREIPRHHRRLQATAPGPQGPGYDQRIEKPGKSRSSVSPSSPWVAINLLAV